ncbi:MAG: hypothetical protein AAB699_03075 [Patescibacteria group bacterium]
MERTKQGLAERQVYVEGYGGDVPFAAVSSKTGEGIDDLLDLILLVAELHEIRAAKDAPVEGYVIEAERDERRGISATLIIKNGTLSTAGVVLAGDAFAPARRLEDFLRRPIAKAEAGTPARLCGWSALPRVGTAIAVLRDKRAAEEKIRAENREKPAAPSRPYATELGDALVIPFIVKADVGGSLEAVSAEIRKQATEKVRVKIVSQGIGAISERDIKSAKSSRGGVIVGFNVGVDPVAKALILRGGVRAEVFDVIYTLIEWVAQLVKDRTPKTRAERVTATARVLKIFSAAKDRQIVGGKVLAGEIFPGDEFRVWRRDAPIGRGRVRELQRFKEKISSASKESEFGAAVTASIEVMPGDRIEAVSITEE